MNWQDTHMSGNWLTFACPDERRPGGHWSIIVSRYGDHPASLAWGNPSGPVVASLSFRGIENDVALAAAVQVWATETIIRGIGKSRIREWCKTQRRLRFTRLEATE